MSAASHKDKLQLFPVCRQDLVLQERKNPELHLMALLGTKLTHRHDPHLPIWPTLGRCVEAEERLSVAGRVHYRQCLWPPKLLNVPVCPRGIHHDDAVPPPCYTVRPCKESIVQDLCSTEPF